MRYLPKFSDDYTVATDDRSATAVLASDLDALLDTYGDDWSLEDAEEIDLPAGHAH